MTRRSFLMLAVLLIAAGLSFGPGAAEPPKADPAKDESVKLPLEVTYYFLPG